MWNGSNWSTLGSGVNSNVTSLALSGSTLYASGDTITTAGGVSVPGVAVWDGSNWSAPAKVLGPGASYLFGTTTYTFGSFGISKYSTTQVATAASYSVTSDAAGVELAYVDASDHLPRYMTYNGTSWGSPSTALTSNPVYGPISIATSSDSSQWLVAWERAGNIEFIKFASSIWGSVTSADASGTDHFPTLPELIFTSATPLAWTSGSQEPYAVAGSKLTTP